MRGEHQRAVFDEGAGIAEIFDIFARGALTGLAAACDGLGTRGVERARMTIHDLGQVRPDVVEVDSGLFGRGVRLYFARFDVQQRVTLVDRVANEHAQARNRAADARADFVFHLHGFHHRDLLPDPHRVAVRRR